jgi:Spy/CpxP family protein refolding chaperone
MKQIFAIVGLTMVMAGTAMAQGGGGGGMQMDPAAMATRMIDGLFKDITITDAVKAKATEIITKTMTDNRAIDRSAPDAMEKRQANTKARNDALKALLTSDADKAKFDANLAAMPQGRGGRPPVKKAAFPEVQTGAGEIRRPSFYFPRAIAFAAMPSTTSGTSSLSHCPIFPRNVIVTSRFRAPAASTESRAHSAADIT